MKITTIEHTVRPQTFEEHMGNLYLEAFNILVDRQRKYGPDNIRKAGQYGIVTRLEDKIERIKQGMNGRIEHGAIVLDTDTQPGDEGVDDGEFDLANYALIKIDHRRGSWGNYPLAENVKQITFANPLGDTRHPGIQHVLAENADLPCGERGPLGAICSRDRSHFGQHYSNVSQGRWG